LENKVSDIIDAWCNQEFMRIRSLTPCILKLDTRLSCVDSYKLRPLYCSFRRLAITTASLL